MWMLALIGFQGTSYLIYDEMQRGTFEQMYMTSLGLENVFFFRVFYDTIFSIVFFFIDTSFNYGNNWQVTFHLMFCIFFIILFSIDPFYVGSWLYFWRSCPDL